MIATSLSVSVDVDLGGVGTLHLLGLGFFHRCIHVFQCPAATSMVIPRLIIPMMNLTSRTIMTISTKSMKSVYLRYLRPLNCIVCPPFRYRTWWSLRWNVYIPLRWRGTNLVSWRLISIRHLTTYTRNFWDWWYTK